MPADAEHRDIAPCPDAETLRNFVRGRLPEQKLEVLAEHVATCARCTSTLAQVDLQNDEIFAALGRPVDCDPAEAAECDDVISAVAKIAGDGGDNSPPPRDFDSPHLRQIGRYEILAKLGEGGMGTVFKARHTHLGKIVALKMLTAKRIRDSWAVARLKREMKAVGALSHPNVVAAHDADEIGDLHFLVLEYVAGIDIAAVVTRCGTLSVPDACEIVRQAAVGLHYAHGHGLVHRDVKPSNLMLTAEGTVKVLDLGLALIATPDDRDDRTSTGVMMGTLDYMAPEQFNDSHAVDARADLYSLGCTLFKLLAGRAPFVGPQYDGPMKKMAAHASHQPPSLAELRSDVSPELDRLVRRLLAKQAVDRFATAAELVTAIGPFTRGAQLSEVFRRASGIDSDARVDVASDSAPASPDVVVPARKPLRRRRSVRWGIVATGFGCLALGLFAAMKIMSSAPPTQFEHSTHGNDRRAGEWRPDTRAVEPAEQFDARASSSQRSPSPTKAPFDTAQARKHQEEWAAYLGCGVESGNSLGMKLVLIPPGEFEMGSTDEQIAAAKTAAEAAKVGPEVKQRIDKSERPMHRVVLSQPFFLGATEVTVGQFRQFVEDIGNVGGFEPKADKPTDVTLNWRTPGYEVTEDLPVTHVSWTEAVAFCQWLSKRERMKYRLPTEAEWEYACRAGTKSQYSFGDEASLLPQYAWYLSYSGNGPAPTATKATNPFGLFDMHGNALEWCHDWYSENGYESAAAVDPFGPAAGYGHVVRGGAWNSMAFSCRSAFRNTALDNRPGNYGFRVVRESAAVLPDPRTPTADPKAVPPPAVAPFDAVQARKHQEAWAAHIGMPVELTNTLGMKFELVPSGEFEMGARQTPAEIQALFPELKLSELESEVPLHVVRITKPFYLGAFEVTRRQYAAFIQSSGYRTDPESSGLGATGWNSITKSTVNPDVRFNWRSPGFVQSEDEPAVCLTRQDAEAFCHWLGDKEKVEYRLPTEAEWEYAARAGTSTRFPSGDDPSSIYLWARMKRPAPKLELSLLSVGSLRPNPWGLFDVCGNVAEWCSDGFDAKYYSDSPTDDPGGLKKSRGTCVARGGNFMMLPQAGRFSARYPYGATAATPGVGFRIVRVIAEAK